MAKPNEYTAPSSQLTAYDRKLAAGVTFNFRSRGISASVLFQFPPKILKDDRSGDWIEGPMRGDEPVAVYGTSGAREIAMAWTYIAGARGVGGKLFTPEIIAEQVRTLRGYFSAPANSEPFHDALIVDFQMWLHTGRPSFTCRIKSVGVSFGTTLIGGLAPGEETPTDPSASAGERVGGFLEGLLYQSTYALRTDVVLEMRLWSRVAEEGMELDVPVKVPGGEDAKLDMLKLKSNIPPDWQ